MLCIVRDWHVSRALYNSCRALKPTSSFSPVFLGLILPVLFFCWCEYTSSIGSFGSKKCQGTALAGTVQFGSTTEQSSCERSLAGTDWAKFLLKDWHTAPQSPSSYVVPSLVKQPATKIAAAARATEIKPNIPCVWTMPKRRALSTCVLSQWPRCRRAAGVYAAALPMHSTYVPVLLTRPGALPVLGHGYRLGWGVTVFLDLWPRWLFLGTGCSNAVPQELASRSLSSRWGSLHHCNQEMHTPGERESRYYLCSRWGSCREMLISIDIETQNQATSVPPIRRSSNSP